MKLLLAGIVFLVLELGLIGFLIFNMIKKRKFVEKSDIFYIAPVFLLVFLMHACALIYNNSLIQLQTSFIAILSLAKIVVETFVFTFDMALLEPIMNASFITFVAYAIMFVLISFTTILAVLVLVKNTTKNFLRKRKAINNNGDIVFGFSEDAKKYNALNPSSIIWDDKIDNSTLKDLIAKNFVIYNERLTDKILYSKIKKGNHHLILFKDSSYSYSEILKIFKNVVLRKNKKIEENFKKEKKKINKKLLKENRDSNENEKIIQEKLKEVEIKFEQIKKENAIYLHIESSIEEIDAIKEEFASFAGTNINSFVTCFNKYQNLAMDFIKDYPISYYVPRNFYNFNYSLKQDKKVNIVFVGFGNVNLELFKTMSMNFQFAKEKTEKSKLSKFKNEPINYYCYDNNDDRLCNDVFTKLDYEFLKDQENTSFSKMEKICNLKHEKINVYSSELKKNIEEILDDNSYTYIIVSLKSDLENISYAESLQGYLSSKTNFKIFTRVKENVFYEKYNPSRKITYFGKEEKLYTHNLITNKTLITLAQSIKSAHAEKLSKNDEFKWYNLPLIHQYSKIYLALSMFFKIGLMGYKLISSDNYIDKNNICGFDDLIDNYSHKNKEEMEKDYNYFFENNASNLMAFIEHSMWNARYYLSGYKPMSLEEFAPNCDGKIGELKTHGVVKKHSSLTSYDGLDTLFKYIYLMKKYGKDYVNHNINEITNEELNSSEFNKIEQYSYDYRLLNFIETLTSKSYILTK